MDPPQNQFIEVREAGHKGLGTFAKVDIPRGTRVISEPALLNLQLDDDGSLASKQILHGFQLLTPSQQESFLGLSEFASEALKFSSKDEFQQDCEEVPELHLRDIAAGEELTLTYIDGVNRPRTRRQSELLQWGFLCTCPAYEETPEGNLKEKRRLELFWIDQVLAINEPTGTQESARGALRFAQKMAGIQKSEGMLNRALKVSYRDAAMYSLKLGNPQMALLWAEKGLEVDLYCLGEDHRDYQQVFDTVDALQGFNTLQGQLNEILPGLINSMAFPRGQPRRLNPPH